MDEAMIEQIQISHPAADQELSQLEDQGEMQPRPQTQLLLKSQPSQTTLVIKTECSTGNGLQMASYSGIGYYLK